MLAIDTFFDVVWLSIIVVIAAFAGASLRNSQIKKYRKRILSLENEMLNDHAEILRLQQELANLESTLPSKKTPVVTMKETLSEEKEENLDGGPKKKAKS